MTDSLNECGFSEAVSIAFQTESWPSRWSLFTSNPSGQRKGACPFLSQGCILTSHTGCHRHNISYISPTPRQTNTHASFQLQGQDPLNSLRNKWEGVVLRAGTLCRKLQPELPKGQKQNEKIKNDITHHHPCPSALQAHLLIFSSLFLLSLVFTWLLAALVPATQVLSVQILTRNLCLSNA